MGSINRSSTQSTYQDHLYSSQYHHSLLGVQKHYQKTTTTRQHDGYTHQPPSVAKTQLLHHLDTAQCGPRHGGTSVRETFLVKGQSACGLGAPDQTYWRAICHLFSLLRCNDGLAIGHCLGQQNSEWLCDSGGVEATWI